MTIIRKLAILFAACLTLASCVLKSSPSSDQIISIGSHRLQIHIEGKGAPTVVIDAGLGEGIEKLRPLQERIAKITRVCTYNRAGYGLSQAGPLPRHCGREAEELKVLLD